MHLSHLFMVVRRRWYVPAVLALLGAVVAVLLPRSSSAEEISYYRATHTFLAEAESGLNLQQLAELVTIGAIPEEVAADLGRSRDSFFRDVDAAADPSVLTLSITAVATDPEEAEGLAEAHAAALLDHLAEEVEPAAEASLEEQQGHLAELESERAALEEQIAATSDPTALESLQDSLASTELEITGVMTELEGLEQTTAGAPLETIEAAAPVEIGREEFENRRAKASEGPRSDENVQPSEAEEFGIPSEGGGLSTPLRAGLGALGGLALGVVVLVAADRLDTRIRTKAEAEQSFRLPVLAEVPPLGEPEISGRTITAADAPLSVVAEAYRGVHTSVLSVMSVAAAENGNSASADGGLVVMVVSAGPEEGKTTSVANLGAIFAESGASTLVFNADYRRPRLQQFFPGSHVEVTGQELGGLGGGRAIETGIEGVKLVTGIGEGQKDPNPAAVVTAQRKVIELARKYFDVVIVDTAPLLVTNDAARLMGDVDAVLVVGKGGLTTREQARAASDLLERLGAPAVGVILTNATEAVGRHYGYYYGYTSESGNAEVAKTRKRARAKAPSTAL